MNFKKLIMLAILAIIIISLIVVLVFKGSSNKVSSNGKLNVVVTNFASFDFIRQIAGDKVNLKMLLNPGADSHSYEPTAADLIAIQNSDLFIYIGGTMEEWTDKVLSSLDTKDSKVLCLSDTITLMEEQEVDGAEHEHDHEDEHDGEDHDHEEVEYDEHIWTSLDNSITMVGELAKVLSELDEQNAESYTGNSDKYILEIKEVQAKIQEIVDNRVRDRLVFGDKMPMQYFISEFGLKVSAAFNGCSTETEPASSTISYLVNVVKQEKIPVVLYIELSNGNVAKTIANETGAQMLQIQSLHNVSKEDFNNNETYVSLMTRNLEVLKKALQ